MVEADEVAVADHEERGGGDRSNLIGSPPGEVVYDRLHALQKREEIRRVRRHGLVVGLPSSELALGRQPRVVRPGRGDLGVVAVGTDVRSGEHEAVDLGRVAQGQARGGERTETETPHIDGLTARDAFDQVGEVIGEPLDRHGPPGVGRVAVALELNADHSTTLGQPRQHVAEAALEGDDAAMQGDERRSCGVATLLVPDGHAIDQFGRHAPRVVTDMLDELRPVAVTSPRRSRKCRWPSGECKTVVHTFSGEIVTFQ